MMKLTHILASAAIISTLSACNGSLQTADRTPVDYVNPYIGNISHLLVPTFPTIQLPNSMLRVYPDRADYTSELLKGLPLIVTNPGTFRIQFQSLSGRKAASGHNVQL